ncbi:MAG: ParA family protein [Agathobacter sp.]|nr:ParA family protein [Agathobacter sp.]
MKNVLVCNQKGGVGKTLIADELAFAFERDGIPCNFYDLDCQGSAIHDSKLDPDAVVSIIDTPGALQPEMIKWFEESDFIIVPTMMSNRDVTPLERMIELLDPFKGKKPILFVFNRWNRFNISKDFIGWFNTLYPDLKTACISDTTDFNQAGARGESIFDFKPSNPACKQIDHIYGAIKYELNIKSGNIAYKSEERTA